MVQLHPAYPEAGTVRKRGHGIDVTLQVPDPADRHPARHDAEFRQSRDRLGHQSLAARLVDRRRPRLDHHGRQPGTARVQRGGQAGRPASRDQQVDHAAASARFSTRTRTDNSAAFSAVKASAVIHAVRTSGSANPSTTTAT